MLWIALTKQKGSISSASSNRQPANSWVLITRVGPFYLVHGLLWLDWWWFCWQFFWMVSMVLLLWAVDAFNGMDMEFSMVHRVLTKKNWVGNKRKKFQSEMWGNAVLGREARENPAWLPMYIVPVETVEYLLESIRCMHVVWYMQWLWHENSGIWFSISTLCCQNHLT